jgi:hypothetical protein
MKVSDLPGRHSLFWKLACLLVAFCLLMIWLSWSWGRYMEERNQFLSDEARGTLSRYAAEAERAWQHGERDGVDNWLQSMGLRETGWVGVIDRNLQSLSSDPLNEQEIQHLTFLRGLDWPIHKKGRPWLRVPFPQEPSAGSLVIELPERFLPGKYRVFWRVITNGVIPGLFTLLLCVGLYRLLVVPLNNLRGQANAWRADQLNVRLSSGITQRPDELGELARAFDSMSERLQSTVTLQQQLLRDLSHELRTPLRHCRTKRSRFRRCGKCSPTTPVTKAAGRACNCSARCRRRAGCGATSTPWRRRWRIFCAMPFVIRLTAALFASMDGVTVTTGICGWKIRAVAWPRAICSGSSRPSPASMARARGMAGLAWG